ncbi:hypothetical protein OK351_05425 [Glutamicibacter sp. MNS18]|uniref:hypothetical protein n=1 Tax=Glutamicibacter sp. MNS18 TaxID=2989817 RepID=UPI0022367408|nr:hypothetical protein [Glutamicibacter sp. MNS18]MCW4464947.1 hypothetical protein [Glutamicibacter sp. MNS18]
MRLSAGNVSGEFHEQGRGETAKLVPIDEDLFILHSTDGKELSRPLSGAQVEDLAARAKDIARLNDALGVENNVRTAALLNFEVERTAQAT